VANRNTGTTYSYTQSICYTRQFFIGISSIKYSNALSISLELARQNATCDFSINDAYSSNGNQISFTYIQIASSWCATSNPYYRISDNLCYTSCPARSYVQTSNSTCFECRYNCYTCTSALTLCLSCNATTDFRVLNGTSCVPITGYY